MKKFAIVVAALALSLTATQAFACGDDKAACKVSCETKVKAGGGKAAKPAPKAAAKKEACMLSTKFEVMGMECQSCADKVTKELKAVKGVEAVSVDFEKGQASVDYCSHELKDTKALIEAVQKAGFEAKLAAEAPKAEAPKTAAPKVLN
ncbi:MAG TPA: heavy metal-associated domain-containing protein [Stenomitos sp.]